MIWLYHLPAFKIQLLHISEVTLPVSVGLVYFLDHTHNMSRDLSVTCRYIDAILVTVCGISRDMPIFKCAT